MLENWHALNDKVDKLSSLLFIFLQFNDSQIHFLYKKAIFVEKFKAMIEYNIVRL